MTEHPVLVIGAGMGGLAAAIDLARAGRRVIVLEKASTPGGKMRQVHPAGRAGIDAGPTVFTMRWVFESLFADAGSCLTDHVRLGTAETLARHGWTDGSRLDLFADTERSIAAIGDFAGKAAAEGYRAFCGRSEAIYSVLRDSFISAQRPGLLDMPVRVGLAGLPALLDTAPHRTLWAELGRYFRDPRLRQLFGRYATYTGSSPFAAPATLMLIAHVEKDGVWFVEGGMIQVARGMEALARSLGVEFRYAEDVVSIIHAGGCVSGVRLASGETLEGGAIVFNGDVSALGRDLLAEGRPAGPKPVPVVGRSLSAVTWCVEARTEGFPLSHHSVFFSDSYEEEFRAIFSRREMCAEPTVYICAQDRQDDQLPVGQKERLLLLVNAPAIGGKGAFGPSKLEELRGRAWAMLERCGLTVVAHEEAIAATGPDDFERLFPASGGALYGRANHGLMGSFQRPGPESGLEGLYLAGGGVHPGPGIPMATLSGRLAATQLLARARGHRIGWRLGQSAVQ
jgi:1-hydroxycarotenoid 3,4-desaturase